MAASTRSASEPFVRVRLIRFSDGSQVQSLKNLKIKVDTFDLQQTATNRPKFPEFDEKMNCFSFETRTKQGRQVMIGVYIDKKKANHICKTTIEELIQNADEVLREYRFSDKGRASMSIELITPSNLRETQRIVPDKIRKHFGHEFRTRYFTTLPVFCGECKKMIWGFNTPGYQCQLCDVVIHEHCINNTTSCQQRARSNCSSMPIAPHHFLREPNFRPVFCDHDGKLIHPLRAWKCSECGIVVHAKCKTKVAEFCGTRQIAVNLYGEWREQNKSASMEAYIIPEDCTSIEMEENNYEVLADIYQRLLHDNERQSAIRDLNSITKPYEYSETRDRNSASAYYNRSATLLHGLTFCAALGHGMSGSVFWVKYSERDFALKAIRKHRILQANEFECVKNERDILIASRENPFIIHLYAVFHDFQRVYLLLEYAPCGTFYDFLLKFGSHFDSACIQWFSGQILCALKYLHANLVMHRDLKPENVLLMRDGRMKLADFGFCKRFTSNTDSARTFCGTAEYIAPEIYSNTYYSFQVDYWSLGVMIYEMIVLKTPFYHAYEIDIKNHVINEDFHYPDKLSSSLRSILTGLLTKNPLNRFGLKELQASGYYSPPYSLEEIEQGLSKCPWKRTIPISPALDKNSPARTIELSRIDEQDICATLTKELSSI